MADELLPELNPGGLPTEDVDIINTQGLSEKADFEINVAKKRKLFQQGREKDFGKKIPKVIEDELRGKKRKKNASFQQPFDRYERKGVHNITPPQPITHALKE